MNPLPLGYGTSVRVVAKPWPDSVDGTVAWAGHQGRWFTFRSNDGIESMLQWDSTIGMYELRVQRGDQEWWEPALVEIIEPSATK